MKNSFSILLGLLSWLAASSYTECYGGGPHDPLWQRLLKTKESRNQHTENIVSEEDSPVFVGPQKGQKEGDNIEKLPGQPDVKFSQYSGRVTVDPEAGRALFYYFAEAENPNEKPLVLWLNGGPGCSSMNGAMNELGPFRVNPDRKTLSYNQYAWNNVANVLFLESPAGVGFSYSNRSSDYVTGDNQTAADSYMFLVNWFERFPEYNNRDFFIAGQGYAGHYIPQLAQLILGNNKKTTTHTVIRLKGIAIGNPDIDDADFFAGMYDYLWTHALISDKTHSRIIKHCNWSADANITTPCGDSMNTAYKEMGHILDSDIYAPLCLNSSTPISGVSSTSFDPCSHKYVHTYLNRNDVQKALHVDNVTGRTRHWESCSSDIEDWIDSPVTVIPVIKKLIGSGIIRVLIYSGDTDSWNPVTATKYSLPKFGAKVETPWYPWYYKHEVGGYAVVYDHNLTFVTVRGAGHTVSSSQPGRALAMFTSFLQGKFPTVNDKALRLKFPAVNENLNLVL